MSQFQRIDSVFLILKRDTLRTLPTAVSEQGGLGTLWRGNVIDSIRYVPISGSNFAFNEAIKRLLPHHDPRSDFISFAAVQTISGALAGVAALCLTHPFLDPYRRRQPYEIGADGNLQRTARGSDGMYRGFSLALASAVPYRAAYFGIYDSLRERTTFSNASTSSLAGIIAYKYTIAHLSATVAEVVAMPCGRARLLLERQHELPVGAPREYGNSLTSCLRQIVLKEGYGGLFKGVSLLLGAHAPIGPAIVLVAYDLLRLVFRK